MLRSNSPVERAISGGETHSFSVSLELDQLLQLVVEQKGVDVVIKTFTPDGRESASFDTPNGAQGPESVKVVARTPGVYRVNVTTLDPEGKGRYEIKIVDLRAATKGELDAVAALREAAKLGAELLKETAQGLTQIRQAENRIRLQIQAAQLMSPIDSEAAKNLLGEVVEGVKALLSDDELDDQEYYQRLQAGQNLRSEVLMVIAASDPERALEFLRATRAAASPDGNQNQDDHLEANLASMIAAKDPKRALQIAVESLNRGYSYQLIDTVYRLQRKDPEAARELAGKIVDKLRRENFLKSPEAVGILFQIAQMEQGRRNSAPAGKERTALDESGYGELINKMLTEALAFTPSQSTLHAPERGNAHNILNFIKSTPGVMEKYAPGQSAAIEKKLAQLNPPGESGENQWQKFEESLNTNSLDQSLALAAQAPAPMREQFYQQAAWRASSNGEYERARQIINEHVTNPFQRQQALKNLEMQSIMNASARGKFDEAMRLLSNLRTPKERATMMLQIIAQSGTTQKRETVLNLLEQARGMLGSTTRAEDQEHMNTLLTIAQTYLRFEPQRAVEIIEPLVDQFNEMCAAALTLNNFPQPYYRDGELMMMNGNNLGMIANQLVQTCGQLARTDFSRAKTIADRVQRPEVRLAIQLAIAQNVLSPAATRGHMNQPVIITHHEE